MSLSEQTGGSELISVIIPLYNHEGYIEDTLTSLISQDYVAVELIVINDGSTDNSREKALELAAQCKARFENYVFIDKENEGIIKTLNLGISIARGKYLYIIASDDVAEANALSTLQAFLMDNPDYGLAVGSNVLIDKDGERCYWDNEQNIVYDLERACAATVDGCFRKSRNDVDFHSDSFGEYSSLLRGNYIPNGYLIRKGLVDEVGGYAESSPMEDYYLMLQLSKLTRFKYLDDQLFRYRWHSTNTISSDVRMGEYQRKTVVREWRYCLRHGLMFLWLQRAYWPLFKYYWSRCKSELQAVVAR